MRIADILLLVSGLLLYMLLAAILLGRKIYVRFPVFFIYNVYAVVASLARLLAFHNPSAFFYTFWWTELGFLLLSIAAVHEAFREVFEGFYLLRWFRWFYFGGIALILALSIINSIFNRPIQVHPIFRIILDFATPINCILAAIFGLFYIFVKVLNVSFRRYPFAIVLGFGISAVGTLIPFIARSEFGKKLDIFIIYGPSVAYYITLLVWLTAFLGKDRGEDERIPPLSPEQMADQVRQYTRLLKGFFGRSNAS